VQLTPKPNPKTLTQRLANPKVVGVLVLGQPSVQVTGAADVLFGVTLDGRAVAPAARMSQMTCA